MASDPFSLLNQLKAGSYENCVILTFNADLFFFEQVVLHTLRSHGCNNNLVLMDLRQYEASLVSAGSHLGSLGKSYSVLPVRAFGVFHPKLILQTGQKNARLILGSGNLTIRGFSSNWEVFTEIHRDKDGTTDGFFQQAWSFIRSVAQNAVGTVDRQLSQFEDTTPWLKETAERPDWPRLLAAQPNGLPIVDQLGELLGARTVRRIVVISPFFDAELRGVRELAEKFLPEEIWLVVQQDKVSLPGAVAAKMGRLLVTDFAPPHSEKSGRAYVHAKAYIFETDSEDFCLWGSPNCSAPAIVDNRNVELAILQKTTRGTFANTLGISSLLEESRCFDPSHLTVRRDSSGTDDVSFRLIGAELCDDTIRVRLADAAFMPSASMGRLLFFVGQEKLQEVDARRETAGVFSAKVPLRPSKGVIICRLVLNEGAAEVVSAPAAVHFAAEIARATPSRNSSDLDRIGRAIQSGSTDWAEGLEHVYGLLFKIEQGEAARASQKAQDGVARKGPDTQEEPNAEPEEIKELAYFVGSGQAATKKGRSEASLLLEDMLRALTAQMLRGIETNADDVDIADMDVSKYQEETDKDSAEGGGTITLEIEMDATDAVKAHKRLRNCYRRLMGQLTKRYEAIRDNEANVDADEFWRLGAVNFLLINGCQRRLKKWEPLGPVLSPEDVLSDYLPAVAVMLGRVRVLAHGNSGPLAMKAKCDLSDHHLRRVGATASVVLSGLVIARRRWLQQPSYVRGKDDPNGFPRFTEIIAARSLASLNRLGLLPTPEEFSAVVQEMIPASEWCADVGTQALEHSFRELVQRAAVIVKAENTFDAKHPATPIAGIREGIWVCAPSTGVTEVLKVKGKTVELLRTGGNRKKDGAVKVSAECVVPTGLSRSL